MGLYDEILITYPLPVPANWSESYPPNGLQYQSKDLGSNMEVFRIQSDGTLIKIVERGQDWATKATNEKISYTGGICIYEYIEPGGWIEYALWFVSGVVQDVRLLEYRPSTPSASVTTEEDSGKPAVNGPRVFSPQDPRVETGVIQFGNDWPGVFIRGDQAFGLACVLRRVLAEHGDKFHPMDRAVLNAHLELLQESDVNNQPTKTND